MAGRPLLDVLIVTSTGAREVLRACLRSLREHPLTLGEMRVLVVDNASTDGTPAMVRAEFGEVVLHELDWNAGFTAGNNVVLRRNEADFTLVLNPDTEVHPGSLDHMVRLMQDRPDIGMAGCRLVQPDGSLDHAAKRSFPTPVGALGHFLRVGRSERAPRWLSQYRATELGEHDSGEVDAVNGAYMLVRREAVADVGLLDEAYWTYMEDLDWCYRFHQKGWKVWYEGAVSTMHIKGGTTIRNRHRPLKHTVAFHRSMGRFYRKFHAGRRPVLDWAIYSAILAKLVVAVTRSTVARRSLV
jgi:N-acetylglucosaminyl-diphospho-decaprenol L-rhamnosyltransferase